MPCKPCAVEGLCMMVTLAACLICIVNAQKMVILAACLICIVNAQQLALLGTQHIAVEGLARWIGG